MSQRNFKEDEVYLSQIFSPIGSFFKSLLLSFFLMIQFIVKRIFLFTGILIVGLILGYFLDHYFGKYTYKQEVIIQPQPVAIPYLYDFFNDFYKRHGDEEYLKSLGLDSESGVLIKGIEIEPVIVIENIFDELHDKYEDNGFLYTIQDYSEKELKSKKFIPFYKYHKVVFEFFTKGDNNHKISEVILNHTYSNPFFLKYTKVRLDALKSALESNQKSIEFTDNYLKSLTEQGIDKKGEKFVVAVTSESELPTLSGVLKQKQEILETILDQTEDVNLKNEVFSIVENTGVVKVKKKLYKRMLFIIPVALIFLTSILYVFLYLYRKTITSEKQLR